MDKFSLLAANSIILTVFAVAFTAALHDTKRTHFRHSWVAANLLLAAALVFYITEQSLPELMVFLVPNGLMIAAFALYSQGAARFNGQAPRKLHLWVPLGLLTATSLPAHFNNNYSITYTITNLMLAFLAFTTAAEYWSGRGDGLSSRYGLSGSFALAGLSYVLRVLQGIAEGRNMGLGLPDDLLLSVHLTIALIFVTASGAFSLALVFERKTAEQRDAAHRDPLTGTFNRREFTLRLKDILADPSRRPFAVIQFDLDHFKSVNDRYGHGAGDEALQLAADVMQWHLRDNDCLARIGGEEFAALLPDIGHDEAMAIAERIRQTIADSPLNFAPDDVRLTLSAGIYHGHGHGLDHKALMRLADEELYRSKHNGRNRISSVSAAFKPRYPDAVERATDEPAARSA